MNRSYQGGKLRTFGGPTEILLEISNFQKCESSEKEHLAKRFFVWLKVLESARFFPSWSCLELISKMCLDTEWYLLVSVSFSVFRTSGCAWKVLPIECSHNALVTWAGFWEYWPKFIKNSGFWSKIEINWDHQDTTWYLVSRKYCNRDTRPTWTSKI